MVVGWATVVVVSVGAILLVADAIRSDLRHARWAAPATAVGLLAIPGHALAGWPLELPLLAVSALIQLYALRYLAPPRWLAAITIEQWRAIDRETEQAADHTAEQPGATSLRVLVVLLTTAVVLTVQEYIGGSERFSRLYPYDGGTYWELAGFVWWSGWRVVGYVVIPMIALALLPGERIRDYHLSLRGFGKHLWIYALLFACVLPAVIAASFTASFRQTYPFYRLANRSYFDLWAWEALYAAQFISLEFFFRGFLLQGLRRVLGANAIFVMIVPYCMIHYGKPMAETFGAIGAGLILGTLAMRTRSIWGGVAIHISVAVTMDVLALRGCPPMGSGRFCHP